MWTLTHTKRSAWAVRVIVPAAFWLLGSGCTTSFDPAGGNLLPTQVAGTIAVDGGGQSWSTPALVSLPADGAIAVTGQIAQADDVEVLDLGSVAAGDQIIVSTELGDGLDAALGLFDDLHRVMIVNDDWNYRTGRYDPYINHIVREDLPHCYLVVASSPSRSTTGTYKLTLRRQPGTTVPAPEAQAVLLDFDGADGVKIGSRAPVDVPAFDAAVINSRYAGHTGEIEAVIEERVRQEYAPYNVQVYSTADDDPPSGGDLTTVYFGTDDSALLGLADNVDAYNGNPDQHAIVYTDAFRLFVPLNPTARQIGTAIGNVAAHEFGHLVGLYHTQDSTEIMDITGSAQSLLVDQTLHEAPLEDSVFPVGSQDPGMLLMEALGTHP